MLKIFTRTRVKTLVAFFFSIIALGYSESAKAGNIDSLKINLQSSISTQDSLVVLKELTKSYQSISIDSTFYYGQIAIEQAGKLNDTTALADIYNYLGIACINTALYEKALTCQQKSKELFELLNNETGLAKTYNNMGIIYEISGKNDIALVHYFKSLDIWQRINEHSPDDPETKRIIAVLYNNLGVVNHNLNKNEKALEYHNKSLTISSKANDKESMSLSLHNIGMVYIRFGNYDKALEFLFQSLGLCRETNDKHGIASTSNMIANVYSKKEDYQKALKYFNEGLQIAEKIQANELIKYAYRGLYLINKETGECDTALRYLTLYHQINDSIYSQQSKNKIAELQNKYKFEKKEQAIKLLEAEQELNIVRLRNSRTWLNILAGGIATLLFLLGLIYFQMNRKKQAIKELVKRNKEIVKSEEYIRERLKSEQQKTYIPQKKSLKNKYASSTLTEEHKEDLKLLIGQTINNKKLYLKSDLTIEILAKHLNVSRTYISQVINEKFNMNFNAFVNEFRIKEARRMLLNKSSKNLTIEAIGLNLGFRSKASFYAAFKKHTGVTPSVFMKYLG